MIDSTLKYGPECVADWVLHTKWSLNRWTFSQKKANQKLFFKKIKGKTKEKQENK